jgi:hypothetical protein
MTELVPYRPHAELAIPVANDTDSWTTVLTEVATLAGRICDTPFVPDGLRGSAPAVAAAILSGRELGLGPMTSLANIHVIKGKPTLSAALMRALILAQGHQVETVDISDTRAVVRGRRRGESEWEEATFTADQAKRAGIVLGGYPQDKLYARATTRLARRKFADVIAGMPYSTEELEDGTELSGGLLPGEADGQPLAAREAQPRTAQRRPRTQNAPSAQAASPVAAEPPQPPQAGAGGVLPPLPGEDETPPGVAADAAPGEPDSTDYDTPGTVRQPQLTAIWTILSRVFKFAADEKEQARAVCAHIVGRDLGTSNDLSKNEAKTVLDTLSLWRMQAEHKGDHPRDYLVAVMVAQDTAGGGDGGE